MDSSSPASTTPTTVINSTSTRSGGGGSGGSSSGGTNNTSGGAVNKRGENINDNNDTTGGKRDSSTNRATTAQKSSDDNTQAKLDQPTGGKSSASNTSTNTNANNKKRMTTKNAEMDLKSSIIEFMRERPFLWNSKHPNYKDHKRRDVEFQAFSKEVDHSVQEIKRVWHVLRTNFFRAHKLLLERPHNNSNSSIAGGSENGSGVGAGSGSGEKLWKYYLAMEYILEGTPLALNDDSSLKETRQKARTSTKTFRDLRVVKRELSSDDISTTSAATTVIASGDMVAYSGKSPNSSMTMITGSQAPSAPMVNQANSNNIVTNHCNNNDDDHLYARSLTSSLKRFDPTTQEVIKLKFQEIIVDYMQRQQKQQQQQQQQQHQQQQQNQYPPIFQHTQPQQIVASSQHQQPKMQLNNNQSGE